MGLSNRERTARSLDTLLAALADPQRRRIVEVLRDGPQSAGALSRQLASTPSVTSKHLRQLKSCGLVHDEHPAFDARVRVYALNAGPLRDLKSWLETTETLWAGQLASLKKHVERGR